MAYELTMFVKFKGAITKKARTKTNTQNNTKTRNTLRRYRHLEKTATIFCV